MLILKGFKHNNMARQADCATGLYNCTQFFDNCNVLITIYVILWRTVAGTVTDVNSDSKL
jgi:hypothetical protein